jgi:hypothetical protein
MKRFGENYIQTRLPQASRNPNPLLPVDGELIRLDQAEESGKVRYKLDQHEDVWVVVYNPGHTPKGPPKGKADRPSREKDDVVIRIIDDRQAESYSSKALRETETEISN